MAVAQFVFESSLQPPLAPTTPGLTSDVVSAASDVIPPGACVLTDQASYTIAANRFFSARPGCVPMVDGVGSDYSLSRGRSAATGAGRVPAVRALWLSALRGAQYVWLSPLSYKRIPWGAREIAAYFDQQLRARAARPVRPVRAQGPAPPLSPARSAATQPAGGRRKSAGREGPQHQPGPRLGRERGGLAGQPFARRPRPRTRPRRAAGCRSPRCRPGPRRPRRWPGPRRGARPAPPARHP